MCVLIKTNQLIFLRTLYGDSLDLWNHIKEACDDVVLTDQRDSTKLTLNKIGFVHCEIILPP